MKDRIVCRWRRTSIRIVSAALLVAVAFSAAQCSTAPPAHPVMFCPSGQHPARNVTGVQQVCVK